MATEFIKNISMGNNNIIKLANSLKYSNDNNDILNCNNQDDILNLSFMTGSRLAYNLDSISDSEMGKSNPLVRIKGYPLYKDISKNSKYVWEMSRDGSGWSEYGAQFEDNERIDTVLDTAHDYYIKYGFENRLQNPITDFDRIGIWIWDWSSNDPFNVGIYQNEEQVYLKMSNRRSNQMQVKYIKNGVKSGLIPMSLYYMKDDSLFNSSNISSLITNISGGTPGIIRSGANYGTSFNIFDILNAFLGGYGGNTALYNVDIEIETNVWLFSSEEALNHYLETGDYSSALNYNGTPRPVEEDLTTQKKYYINCDIWESSNPTDAEKTYTNKNYLEIYVNENLNRPFSLTLNSDTQRLHLNTNNVLDEDIIKMRQSNDGGETWHNVTLDNFHNDVWRYTEIKKVGRKYQGAEIYTNIPIFKNALQSSLYFNDKIDEENSLNPTDSIGDTIINKLIDIGKGLKIKNELNIQSVKTSMSEIVFSNDTFFDELASLFNDDSIVTQIKQGLLMHSNPQDIFIDMFALPFDVAPLVINSMSRNKMDFGTYEHTFTNSYKVISKPKEITMFSTKINPIFNDWRDYQLNISLYLPYCNIISLPIDEIMNKTLSCTFIFDITSCTIKYFIKASNITILTCEGVVRYELPLSASNNIQGFKQKIGGASQIIGGIKTTYEGGGQLAEAVDKIQEGKQSSRTKALQEGISGTFTIGEGLSKITSGVRDILRPTPKNYTGNYSSSCAFYDELSAYLIIEQANLIYSDSIKHNFNLPDSRVSTLSSCHGYTEIDYIDLQSSCTQSEREAILNLLSNGFYV